MDAAAAAAAAAAGLTGTAVAKRLASCNKATRDRAVRLLGSWLSTSTSISDDDLLKIWKGLFYCLWHADKVPFQVDLANRLASLLLSLDPPLAGRYLSSFLSTIRREWSGIDHHRLDKFYVLIRSFVRNFFAFLRRNRWDNDLVSSMISVLSQNAFLSVDKYPAQGVNYHISQVYLDEVLEFLPVGIETFDALLKPFFAVLETSSDKTLIAKVKVNVFDRMLENGRGYLGVLKSGGALDRGGELEKLGRIGLVFGFSKRFLDMASAEGTVQSSRKLLFDLHEKFAKLEKDLEKSGVEIPEISLVSNDAVEVDANGSGCCESENSRPSKKRKKSKKGSENAKPVKKGSVENSESIVVTNGSGGEPTDANGVPASVEGVEVDGHSITFDEILISNLQKQFQKVAEEEGMLVTPVTSKKRKRKKVANRKGKLGPHGMEDGDERTSSSPKGGEDGITPLKSAEKSSKRVRFSMKNNIVWKPHSPLPPQSLRLPPSATPRGSALKKGVLPGPVKETPPTSKKFKAKVKASSVKKVRRILKSASPGVKRVRKLQTSA